MKRPWLWLGVFGLGLLLPLLLPVPAFAQRDLRIIGIDFPQHRRPTETTTFRVQVLNREPTAQGVELVIISTNINTAEETVLADVGSGIGALAANGGTFTFITTVSAQPAGIYTITFRILDGDSPAKRVEQVRGKFPLHVGEDTESLRVFPEVIHLGAIPPGRHMHPMPIEVRWDFYRFTRQRFDVPFFIRVYTDNAARYGGVPGALRRPSAGGLVSLNGKYVIPLKTWNLNYGPDAQETGWDGALAGPPPVDEDDFWIGPRLIEGERSETFTYHVSARGRNVGSAAWVRVPDLADMTADPASWRRMIGQDPFDNRFATDLNPTGDITLASPFTFYLATDAGATAVEGSYAATLIVELWEP